MAMPKEYMRPVREYLLTGNYGTFEVTKLVEIVGANDWEEVDWQDAVWSQTGIMTDLEEEGWEFDNAPDGEDWEVQRVT